MLEDSKYWTFDAPSLSLVDFKAKEPLLRLGLNSHLQPISSFELTRDLENCFNVYCGTNSNEFKMDFTLPANMLMSPIKKLKMLPEKLDFSEFLLFDSNLKNQLVLEQQNDVSDHQKDSELYYIADMDQGYGELQKVVDAHNIVTKLVVQPNSGMFSGLLRNTSVSTQRMTKLFIDADRARIQQLSYNNTKSRLLSAYLRKVILDKQLHLTPILSGLPFTFQEKKLNCPAIQSLEQSRITVQNNIQACDSLKEQSFANIKKKVEENIEVVGQETNENLFVNITSVSASGALNIWPAAQIAAAGTTTITPRAQRQFANVWPVTLKIQRQLPSLWAL